ncbi:hypothetical protein [Orenia marismortui]|uniref:Uncharacterized protein n=1 Tax=Orenia marismortui TaxID=46469 RepID=A0A4R8H198_9FIRM|nr:hypothetical protein [Orenia marismortui]TDX48299.1 hypothetical protein C7959_13026 [Orenia marismortui]
MRSYTIRKALAHVDSEEIIDLLKDREDVEVIDCKEEDLIGPYYVSGDEVIIKLVEED